MPLVAVAVLQRAIGPSSSIPINASNATLTRSRYHLPGKARGAASGRQQQELASDNCPGRRPHAKRPLADRLSRTHGCPRAFRLAAPCDGVARLACWASMATPRLRARPL